ncbi:Cytohesin-1 [Amphibalanus amphitrite]|uniref:Cytohesin-1 n=1 Tax=Amphibalanus amphitrite TaxID=1232801 RepID=A0A6A4WB50_AMPAM|nr:Cytohesin-1 [Amphibalanus amphitrite]
MSGRLPSVTSARKPLPAPRASVARRAAVAVVVTAEVSERGAPDGAAPADRSELLGVRVCVSRRASPSPVRSGHAQTAPRRCLSHTPSPPRRPPPDRSADQLHCQLHCSQLNQQQWHQQGPTPSTQWYVDPWDSEGTPPAPRCRRRPARSDAGTASTSRPESAAGAGPGPVCGPPASPAGRPAPTATDEPRLSERLSTACRRFNVAPEPAVEAMISSGVLPRSARAVAQLLLERRDLDKRAIGAYLAAPGQFPSAVLEAFMASFDFCELPLLAALRKVLSTFLLHGENQRIYHVLTKFAAEYGRQNDCGQTAHDWFTLAYALFLLSQLLHDPKARADRPSPERFVDMVRGCGPDTPPPDELLRLYRQVSAEPLPAPATDTTGELRYALSEPQHRGWLCKQGGRVKTWKDRYFILKNNCLYYFVDPAAAGLKGMLILEDVTVRAVLELERYNCFELVRLPEGDAQPAHLKSWKQLAGALGGAGMAPGRHTSFRLSAATQSDMAEWMRAIRRSIVLRPLHSTVRAPHSPSEASRRRQQTEPPGPD